MPITINGTGSITGISAGGLPDDCITTADIAANAVTYAKLGTTEQGQLCKAWVNFNGTGTVAIRASYNVSSITDNGVGLFVVNFSTAFADTSYAAVCSAGTGSTSGAGAVGIRASATTSQAIFTFDTAGNGADFAISNVAIFR